MIIKFKLFSLKLSKYLIKRLDHESKRIFLAYVNRKILKTIKLSHFNPELVTKKKSKYIFRIQSIKYFCDLICMLGIIQYHD
ncbi:hypothetical protein BpHYR1_045778 [Brachionus plicatilis]|uniref:Uncharacterized protein n=1 Tax=Brachionus plicatilis TaxID=10195 RepID=A0A3M7RE66_BRAPC|nr:hypothetical protein BpHYR1_045778 [Brachionus plicatilis]